MMKKNLEKWWRLRSDEGVLVRVLIYIGLTAERQSFPDKVKTDFLKTGQSCHDGIVAW